MPLNVFRNMVLKLISGSILFPNSPSLHSSNFSPFLLGAKETKHFSFPFALRTQVHLQTAEGDFSRLT